MKLDAAAILAICPLLKLQANDWVDPLNQVIVSAELNTPNRLAYFMANARHESLQLTVLRENLSYAAGTILRLWPLHFTAADVDSFAHQPERIANRAYANRMGNGFEDSGDGWKYRGGGIFQITGKGNYRTASLALFNEDVTLIEWPELLARIDIAAMAAAWFWREHSLNDYADRGDFDGCCDAINLGHKTERVGDSNGFKDRAEGLRIALDVIT